MAQKDDNTAMKKEPDANNGSSELSEDMKNFLKDQEIKSRAQALLDAAIEAGLDNYTLEDALRDLHLEQEEDNNENPGD